MAGYLEWLECDNCGYESTCLDVNTKTRDTIFHCRKCGKKIENGVIIYIGLKKEEIKMGKKIKLQELLSTLIEYIVDDYEGNLIEEALVNGRDLEVKELKEEKENLLENINYYIFQEQNKEQYNEK